MALAEWGAVALAASALALRLSGPDPRIGDDDFGVFYAGAASLAAGRSPYVGDFVSPPWFALALLPLTLLPLPLARGLWFALNLALLLTATVACARLVGLTWPRRRLLLATRAFARWPPVEFGLKLGQNSLRVWLLILIALLAAQHRSSSGAGGALALALVKPQLAFLFVGGLALHLWRQGAARAFLLALAAIFAALVAVTAALAPDSYADLLALRPRTWNYWGSTVALPPLLAAVLGSPAAGLVLYVPLAVLGAAVLLRQWTAAKTDLAYPAALTACATLLLTPYAYPYDAVLLQLPLLWLLATAQPLTARRVRWGAVLGVLLLAALWLLERPADYSVERFLGLAPPLILLLSLIIARHRLS